MEIILKYFSAFSVKQLEQFKALEGLYKDWNSRINVISRKDIGSLYEKHVLHSLSIAAAFEFGAGDAIIDIGTGGGFPGIPLAIFFPDVQFHLVDSIAKKLKVVDAIVKDIELKNVTTQHIRAEEIKDKKFDFVVSRAVAPLKDLWKWSKLLLRNKAQGTRHKEQDTRDKVQEARYKPGLVCLKGGDLTTEIHDSGLRPRVMEIKEIFPEEFFTDKFILYVTK